MALNIIDVSNICCRRSIASGENAMLSVGPVLVCLPAEAVTTRLLVLLEISFNSCPADPFEAAGRSRRVLCGFIVCFLTCSDVPANAFALVERLVLFFALLRPVPDFVRVREFFRCPEFIATS